MIPALDFNIQVQRGKFNLNIRAKIWDGITGIYGPSGHGKTTLLHALAGLLKPNQGYLRIMGETLYDSKQSIFIPPECRDVGIVFQEFRLFPHMTIHQNLLYGYSKSKHACYRPEDIVATLQIAHLLDKKPIACSGGEKQRVAIGRAILSGARVLLMDEPFAALDVNLRSEIIPFLNTISRKYNLPILIVSHHLPDLLSLTNKLMLIRNGQLLAQGKFQELILKDECLNAMNENDWYSALHLQAVDLIGDNIVRLKSNKSEMEIQIPLHTLGGSIENNQKVRVLINSQNIVLARQPVENISLRNQIKGTILKIFNRKGLSYCIVDVGDYIVAEITEMSQSNMNFSPGQTVYCLFKSAALKATKYSPNPLTIKTNREYQQK